MRSEIEIVRLKSTMRKKLWNDCMELMFDKALKSLHLGCSIINANLEPLNQNFGCWTDEIVFFTQKAENTRQNLHLSIFYPHLPVHRHLKYISYLLLLFRKMLIRFVKRVIFYDSLWPRSHFHYGSNKIHLYSYYYTALYSH